MAPCVILFTLLINVLARRMPSGSNQVLPNSSVENFAEHHARKTRVNADSSADEGWAFKKTGAGAAVQAFEEAFETKQRFFDEAMQHAKLSSSELGAKKSFKKFLKANYRHYFQFGDTDEYRDRLGHFSQTLENIEIRNAYEKNHSTHPNPATHGITKYADWSEAEFKQLLGHKLSEIDVLQDSGADGEDVSGIGGVVEKIKDVIGIGNNSSVSLQVFEQTAKGRQPGEDKFSNCGAIKQAYGCRAKLSNGQTMSEVCPDECGSAAISGLMDKYSNCASIKAQHGCNAQLQHGEAMSQACPVECPTSSLEASSSVSSKAPCNKNWVSTVTVRNQGACGDCWAFATVEAIRSAYINQHGSDPGKLSTQFLVECMMPHTTCEGGVNGCCGGNPYLAMQWIEKQGGIPTQASYGDVFGEKTEASLLDNRTSLLEGGPVSHNGRGMTYSGNNPTEALPCKKDIPKAVTLTGQVNRVPSEHNMASHVCSTGTLAIAVDANAWNTYTGGVLTSVSCGTSLDHAVHAIGLDQKENSWVVQNSWGPDWGVTVDGTSIPKDKYSNCPQLHKQFGCEAQVKEGLTVGDACPASCTSSGAGGFIMLAYGGNTCGLAGLAVAVPSTGSA